MVLCSFMFWVVKFEGVRGHGTCRMVVLRGGWTGSMTQHICFLIPYFLPLIIKGKKC